MQHPLSFESQLPELSHAFDLDAVARLFEQRWPGAGVAPTISRCRLQDVKYRPGERCTTTYTLLAAAPGQSAQPTIGMIETLPNGQQLTLFEDDLRLPWLSQAANPDVVVHRLAALLPADKIVACQVVPVRYKPGLRCVLRYDLLTEAGSKVVWGKLLAEGGEQLMTTLVALHARSEQSTTLPRIPRPLAYWPDLHLLLQPNVVGETELNTQAFDPTLAPSLRERWLQQAGSCLAGLHACAGPVAAPRRLADDLLELHEYSAPLRAADEALATRYAQTIDAVAAAAQVHDEAALMASHGAFRTDQFMIAGDHLVMIDLDTYCWANPARDLGNFLAYLRWKAIRQPQQATFIERVGQIFLDGYQAAGGTLDRDWLAIYQAASLLKIAGRRYRSLTFKEWPLVPTLLDAARYAL